MTTRKVQALSVAVVLFTTSAFAQDGSTVGPFLKTRQDVDYRLNTVGVSASLITPYGLFRCDPAVLDGRTRIDSFNNIVGVSDVREAEWKHFSARDIGCRYGAKVRVAGGELKGGFGYRDYLGKTADEPGGKHISIKGAGALLDYHGGPLDARLEWKREVHDYTLRHQTSVGDYDSLVDATEDTYKATATIAQFHLDAVYVNGNKDNVYTTPLFPTNRFDYAYTDVALGMRFEPDGNGLTLFAPILGEGSYRGSFNPLRGGFGLKGVQLAGQFNGLDLDLKLVRHKGRGSRPYLPATQKLTEEKDETTVSVGVSGDGWKTRIENSRFEHTGLAAIAHPTYAGIVGGWGPFTNLRREDKWTLSASFPVTEKLSAELSLYYAQRLDRQYTLPEHDYSEKGGFIEFKFSY